MTHRFDFQPSDQLTTILFQGLLDRPALSELEALCRARTRRGTSVRVLLAAGTKVEPGLVDDLVRIEDIALEAESPFLSRWIQSCQNGGPTER
jgi:hypothetical protein